MLERFIIFNAPVDEDSFLITPAIVITRARHEDGLTPAPACMIMVQWLCWGFALSINFTPKTRP